MTEGPGTGEPGQETGYDDQPGQGNVPPEPGPPPGSSPPPGGYGPPPGGYNQPPGGYGSPPAGPPGYGQGPGGYGYGGGGPYAGYGAPRAPKPGLIPLRPLNLGEILDGAFTAMRWNPKAVLGPSAIVAAVEGILIAVAQLLLTHYLFANVSLPQPGTTTNPTPSQLGSVFAFGGAASFAGYAIAFVADTLLTGFLAAAIGQGVLGRKETFAGTWRLIRSRIWSLIGAALLSTVVLWLAWAVAIGICVGIGVAIAAVAPTGVGVLVGVLLGIAASIFFAIVLIRWSLALPVVVLERAGPGRAVGRSWHLARGSFWRIWWISFVTGLITGIAAAIIQVPFSFAGGGFMAGLSGGTTAHVSTVAVIVGAIGGIIARTVTAPLKSGTSILLYTDLRMRREGMDIELRAVAASGGQYPGQPASGQPAPGQPSPGQPSPGQAPPSQW